MLCIKCTARHKPEDELPVYCIRHEDSHVNDVFYITARGVARILEKGCSSRWYKGAKRLAAQRGKNWTGSHAH